MKSITKVFKPIFVCLWLTFFVACEIAVFYNTSSIYAVIIAASVSIAGGIIIYLIQRGKIVTFVERLGNEITKTQEMSLTELSMPVIISDENGIIGWDNDLCCEVRVGNRELFGA